MIKTGLFLPPPPSPASFRFFCPYADLPHSSHTRRFQMRHIFHSQVIRFIVAWDWFSKATIQLESVFFFWSYYSKIRPISLARSDLFFSNRTISYIRIISSAFQVHAHPMSPCMRTIFNLFTVPITHNPLTTVKRHVIVSGTSSDLRCLFFFSFSFSFFLFFSHTPLDSAQKYSNGSRLRSTQWTLY